MKWREFLLIIAFRFVAGAVLGLLIGIPIIFFAGSRAGGRRHSVLVDQVQAENSSFLVLWFGGCALVGGIIAVATIPRWKTPWYKYPKWNSGGEDDHTHIA